MFRKMYISQGGEDMREKNNMHIGKFFAKTLAAAARGVALGDTNSACLWFAYQPKEPKDMSVRLKNMQAKK